MTTFRPRISLLERDKDVKYDEMKRKFTGKISYEKNGGILDPTTKQIVFFALYELEFHPYFTHISSGKITLYDQFHNAVRIKNFPGMIHNV